MIAAASVVLNGLIGLCVLGLIFGLIRPVYVLWFLDRFNRLKVIKVYGIGFLILVIIRVLIRLFLSMQN